MSRNTATVTFQALEIKGTLLPASLLEEISKLERPKEMLLEPGDYGLSRGERLRDRIDAAWVLTKELWEEYGNLRGRAGQSIAGQHFGMRLLREVFSWSGIEACNGWRQGESSYAINYRAFAGSVPLILRGIEEGELDKGSAQFGQEGRRRSPHSCLQECLNADDSSNWGVLISGDRLRLLHDNPSLVKPAYLAADLELLIEGERFDEFSVLWLLLHASRFEHPHTGRCVLDSWKQKAEASGERVLGALRGGVQSALQFLGTGFLNHPANGELRDALFKHHTLSKQHFHEQLLRLVYRFLFLFTAEDRGLLFPRDLQAVDPRRRIYREGYSVSRLRELAIKRSAYEGDYGDLWELQRLVFQQLTIGNSPLGLPGLGGLFSLAQCPDLQGAELCNGPLLRAIKAIGWFDAGGTFTRVRYRDLNTEELGSVYEGLLELHPQLEQHGSQWLLSYGGGAGSDRKTTGSYYTPDALVQELIKSALVPVIEDRLSKANGPADQEKALLDIKVIDPACGSGHFLLAAARRLAVELAQVRAGVDQPSEEDRQHALRDVVARCIYAVDKNPMAVELCKVALWIEAIDPGKPLSFLDAHIQCGDSLLGVFDPKVLEEGIPDEAYKQLTGDDTSVCSSLKKENAAARKNNNRRGSNRGIQGSLDLSGTKPRSRNQEALEALEAMPETTLVESAAKQAAYANWLEQCGQDPEALASDMFTAAFFLEKTNSSRATVPTTEHLLRLLGEQPVEKSMEAAVVQAAHNFRFFHWHLRFGEVMKTGGFDCVIGNPPWEGLTPDIKEWFASYEPSIRAADETEQKSIVARLTLNPEIASGWNQYRLAIHSILKFLKGSGRYLLFAEGNLGKGDFNTYRFFVELAIGSCNSQGICAQYVPDNLYSGANAQAHRIALLERTGGVFIDGFDNTERAWFPAVHASMKFCSYLSSPLDPAKKGLFARFGISNPRKLVDARPINLAPEVLREMSGESFAFPEIRSEVDARLFDLIYASGFKFADFRHSLPGKVFATELHMGNDRYRFGDDSTGLPLYEGRMVDLYDHRAKAYISGRGRSAVWEDMPFGYPKSIRAQWTVLPSELCTDELTRTSLIRIGLCGVASPTNQRTLVCCLIPKGVICGGKVPTLVLGDLDIRAYGLFLGYANSIVLDYIARKKATLSMTQSILDTLPMPARLPASEEEDAIAEMALGLAAVGDEFSELRSGEIAELYPGTVSYRILPEDRHETMCEIDSRVAKAFGLGREELLHIFGASHAGFIDGSFPQLYRKEMREFGEFKTRRLVLEAWVRLFGD